MRLQNKLTNTSVLAITRPGRHSDGAGLYLNVSKSGSKSWVFMWVRNGRRREMGLGSFGRGTAQVSLASARQKAMEIRTILGRDGDPFAELTERIKEADQITFGEAADQFVSSMAPGWRNDKHIAQWRMTLTKYAKPLRSLPVAQISVEDVLGVLKPIWQTKSETASRLRGRIEKVLDFARANGWRHAENPARWRGHLDGVLPSPRKRIRKHHRAMSHADVPAFYSRLQGQPGLAARALELTILTGARTSEVLGATWDEFDFDAKVWTIPAERMKANRQHRVPLSPNALFLLQSLRGSRMSEFLFAGQSAGEPLSNMAMSSVLKRMKVDVTVHGFRSSFRDWAAEETSFPGEIAEQALAHVVGNETERAYRRGDALEKRRELMGAWAEYVGCRQSDKIISMAIAR